MNRFGLGLGLKDAVLKHIPGTHAVSRLGRFEMHSVNVRYLAYTSIRSTYTAEKRSDQKHNRSYWIYSSDGYF